MNAENDGVQHVLFLVLGRGWSVVLVCGSVECSLQVCLGSPPGCFM